MTRASNSGPTPKIDKLPVEMLARIFELYVETYPEVLDIEVVDLYFVSKRWRDVANITPRLWTKINITFPFKKNHLDAMHKRIQDSKLQNIDVSIDFRNPDPDWDGEMPDWTGGHNPTSTNETIRAKEIRDMLLGTENRWKSFKFISSTWLPFHTFMKGLMPTHLPSLESISMMRDNAMFAMDRVPFDPVLPNGPMTLFGGMDMLPKLRDLSLSAIPVNWNGGLNGCQNLRKIKINNLPEEIAPSFEEFATFLSFSPRLEYLDVSGYCPRRHTLPGLLGAGDPPIPIVRLPRLKEFVFGWKDPQNDYCFLQMFQIGSSLETLTLLDTESGSENWRTWRHSSELIFEILHELSSGDFLDDVMTPDPFISMRGVKKLKIKWTKAARSTLIPLLGTLTEVEDILLEDVNEGVLEDVTSVQVERSKAIMGRPLKVDLRWELWQGNAPASAAQSIQQLKIAGIETTVYQAAEDWRIERG